MFMNFLEWPQLFKIYSRISDSGCLWGRQYWFPDQGTEIGAHVVVGTPGKTVDLIRRKALQINNIRWVILDEADEMLNMGFKEDLDIILAETPEEKQTLLFSATMSSEIIALTRKFLKNTLEISMEKKNTGEDNVKNEYYMVHLKVRYNAVKQIVDS